MIVMQSLRSTRTMLFVVVVAATLLFVLVGFAQVQPVGAQNPGVCAIFEVDLLNPFPFSSTATVFFVRTSTGEILSETKSLTLEPGESGTLFLMTPVPDTNFFPGGGPGFLLITNFPHFADGLTIDNCVGGRIGDGRINDGPNELGAPLAGYCDDGSISVWDINDADGNGTLGFTVTAADIDAGLATAIASGAPYLIGSGLGNSLWASPDDFLTFVGPDLKEPGKEYRFSFAGDYCDTE